MINYQTRSQQQGQPRASTKKSDPLDYDYPHIARSEAVRTYSLLSPGQKANILRQHIYERECDLQDLAEKRAANLRKAYPTIFGTHYLGYKATYEYGIFEEVFMHALNTLLVRDIERRDMQRRAEYSRRYRNRRKEMPEAYQNRTRDRLAQAS
jgi:hypothetical protein